MGALKAGLAKVVITPPVGVRLSGYANRTQPSIGILDDLYAKALVLDDGKERLALVVCDLIGLDKSIVDDARRRMRELTHVEEKNIMITSIHTHTGPDLRFVEEAYVENLQSQIAGAVYSACNDMKEARIGVARGECVVGSNRRNPNSPYGPYFLYSWPEGPMDPTVLVLRIQDTSGRNIGALVNYSCHPVTLGPRELRISRDYPGYALRVLENALGRDIVAVFMNGCCGNINPRWVWDGPVLPPPLRLFPERLEERLSETRRLGHILGAESLKTAESIADLTSDLELRAAKKEVELPVRDAIPERLLQWMKNLKGKERKPLRNILWEVSQGAKTIVTEVQVFSLGSDVIVGLPGEVFVEYQLELRRKSGSPFTFVSELANDSIFYVPTPEAYEEGGYEPTAAVVAAEAGGILIQNVLSLLDELK